MNDLPLSWESSDPHSISSWAGLLGLVQVPMFGLRREQPVPGEHAILLDGARSSLAFSVSSDPDLVKRDDSLSWSWSSDVPHTVILDPTQDLIYLRAWDDPRTVRHFKIPKKEIEAHQLLKALNKARPPRKIDVIHYVLENFRRIRHEIDLRETIWAIRLLNGFLLAVDAAKQNEIDADEFLRADTLGEAMSILPPHQAALAQVADLPPKIAGQSLGVLAESFFMDNAPLGLELDADLLLRHASSKLYQEAHLQIERDPQLSLLPGLGSVQEPRGKSRRDVRFTPTNLARALVQHGLTALGLLPETLVVCDPACGSGVFLRECIRELGRRQHTGCVRTVGYEISEISVCMSNFSLELARIDLEPGQPNVDIDVRKVTDSLLLNWPQSDLILMNPPFISVEHLDDQQRSTVDSVLGATAKGRVDIAMAFVLKAVEALKPKGVLACVLPTNLFNSKSGRLWRKRLQEEADLTMLGCFEGYRYFSTSLVETGFFVLQRKGAKGETARAPIEIIIGSETHEDEALRLSRLSPSARSGEAEGIDIYDLPRAHISPTSWRPLRKRVHDQRIQLERLNLPKVGNLFRIRQGIRTGGNKAFLLSSEELKQLQTQERRFFRPAVGTRTLQNGKLERAEFVFYPYSKAGLLLETEDDVRRLAPNYYARWLLPQMNDLKKRARIKNWWELSEKREWQVVPAPRIVSTYFGRSGSFAFDNKGKYVVVNGHAWTWEKPIGPDHAGKPTFDFQGSDLPWAYLALLNSTLFEEILSWYTPRLQGGQMRLESRFLSSVPLPDLTDPEASSGEIIEELANLGKAIHSGRLGEVRSDLDVVAASAYNLLTS